MAKRIRRGIEERERTLIAELYPSLRRFAAVVGPVEVDPDDLVQEAVREYLAEQFAVFSDERYSHSRRIFGDNSVFGELEWTATHTGDMPLPDGSTFPATGKTIHARVAYSAAVNDDGQVVEVRGYPDLADAMGQLGMMG